MKTSILILLALTVTTLASAGETRGSYARAFSVVNIEDVTYKNLPFLAISAEELQQDEKTPGAAEARRTERASFVCHYFGYGDAFLSDIVWDASYTRAWEATSQGGASFLQLKKLKNPTFKTDAGNHPYPNAVFSKVICLRAEPKPQALESGARPKAVTAAKAYEPSRAPGLTTQQLVE